MYLCICICIYKYIYGKSNNKIYVIMLKNERRYNLCQQLLIICSLLTFTYAIVFILWGVGCLLHIVLTISERRSHYWQIFVKD